MEKRISAKWINELKENEIFVFGSNLSGFHRGGAAALAYKKFGAVWGQGIGLQGQSYAIPTMFENAEEIKQYIDDFLDFAQKHSNLNFLLTEIACGIAGFTIAEIAPFFTNVISHDIKNIFLPESFYSYIENSIKKNNS